MHQYDHEHRLSEYCFTNSMNTPGEAGANRLPDMIFFDQNGEPGVRRITAKEACGVYDEPPLCLG
ncbi:MAG TPA: hypothetical protein VLH38_05130 [Patescibacteria group bacterium]|nr:hypothetical protein [Patescibacteria group bacterium]